MSFVSKELEELWRRRESKTSVDPDTSGACTDSRALAATFVRSDRFEFGTVESVWAAGGQGFAVPLARQGHPPRHPLWEQEVARGATAANGKTSYWMIFSSVRSGRPQLYLAPLTVTAGAVDVANPARLEANPFVSVHRQGFRGSANRVAYAYQIRLIPTALLVAACAAGCGNRTAGTGTDAGQQASGGHNTSGAGGTAGSGTGGTPDRGGATGSGGAGVGGGGVSSGGAMGQSGSGGSHGTGGSQGAGGSPGTGGTTASGGVSGTGGGAGGVAASGAVTLADAAHVRLLPGSPFYDRQQLHRQGYLAAYSADKLLYPYRQLAKLAQASGVTSGYSGWDTGFLAGHMTGHYLSATSRMAAATGDTSFATKANYVVGELAKCQAALNQSGYLAAFPSTVFDWLEGKSASNNGIVVPYYMVHKIMAGLLDAYHYLGNQQALTVATKMADYFQARLAALPSATIEKIFRTDGSPNPQNEFGAMSDVYSELYTITGQQKYLDTAKIFNRS